MINFILLIVDFISFYVSLLSALYLRNLNNFNIKIFQEHFWPFTLILFFWILIFYIFDLYNIKKLHSLKEYTENYFTSIVINILISILIFYFLPFLKITPKIILFLFIIIFIPLNIILRELVKKINSTKQEIFILIGTNKEIDEIENFLNSHLTLNIKTIKYKNLEEIMETNFDYLIIPDEFLKDKDLIENLLNFKNINILTTSTFKENFLNKLNLDNLSEDILIKFILNKNKIYDFIKNFLDKILALLFLILSLPLWPFIILGIKFSSPGPIFFQDIRIGEKEKKFILYKFRTMHNKTYKNPEKEKIFGIKDGDERVFWFGKILRKFHLDEIPQLLNVIKGDLSLIGPRPDSEIYYNFLKKNISFYRFRTFIKPGITGWAQVNKKSGDSLEEAKERLEYDLYYLKNRNLILDLFILIKTFKILLTLWGK
jgi:lipopolysaccharide/colanic/teichoic acid biosynthesis glycosyltransferase